MFQMFQYFLVNKIKEQITTVDVRCKHKPEFAGTMEHSSIVLLACRTAHSKSVFHESVP